MNGSIRRRGKQTWELTLDVGRDTQGRRRRKFVNVKGTKADAERKLRELATAVDKGIPVNTERVTVAEWMQRWLDEYVVPNTRQRTVERYRSVVTRHVAPRIGHIQLLKLSPNDVRALEAGLLAQGMAPKGVQLVHGIVSGFLKFAVRMEVLWRNVAQAVTPPKAEPLDVAIPDLGGVRRILKLAKQERDPSYPCLHLIAYTGVRRGEALGLHWDYVDLVAGTISIVQTLGRSTDKGLIFQPPKTSAGRRLIELDSRTVEVLRAHRGEQLLHKADSESAYNDNGLVFADPLGAPTNPMAVTRAFQRLARRVGITKIRIHDLRHFHASVMLQQKESLALVSQRLGHAHATTTVQLYGHVLTGWQKQAAETFAQVMDGE